MPGVEDDEDLGFCVFWHEVELGFVVSEHEVGFVQEWYKWGVEEFFFPVGGEEESGVCVSYDSAAYEFPENECF